MPRLFHRPPKYSHHRGTNQAVVSVNGRRVYLGPYGSASSHEKYRAILQEWQRLRHQAAAPRRIRQPEADADTVANSITPATLRARRSAGLPVTCDELILVYRRHAHEYYRKAGVVTREAELIDEVAKFLRQRHGRLQLESFGPVALDELRDAMIEELDWSRTHINKQVRRIVAMFTWAAEKELVTPTVPLALKALAGLKKGRCRARETKGVECVSDADVDATLPHLPLVIADMVRLQRLTGARPSEVCMLRPRDLNRSSDVWLYAPDSHKTEHHDKSRVVAIGPQAQEILKPYLARRADRYCFSPSESERRRRAQATAARKTPLSCGNNVGSNRVLARSVFAADHYTSASYRRAIHRVCEKHRISKWAPNRLRHTAATEIRKQFGLEAAQVVCGHQRADVTQIYAERDLTLAIQVAREVG
jgi:integrase